MQEETPKAFKKVSETEYEITLNGRTKTIQVPFEKVSQVFKCFISNGGIIDPETGTVQTDIISLISSFKEVGNTLLTTHDETGKVLEEGNCANLSTADVIALFTLATTVVEDFIKELTTLQKTPQTLVPNE